MKPAGYAKLIQQFNLGVIPNWHESGIHEGTHSRVESADGRVRELFTPIYEPQDTLGSHLEFALKYDGTNLLILSRLFAVVPQEQILEYIQSKPTGKYARRIWYLYELLTGQRLPIEDLKTGNYVDLLESNEYYTAYDRSTGKRHRIRDNLLGNARFCPIIRKTTRLLGFAQSDLTQRCRKIVEQYPPELLTRALSYFYSKETKSSFAIEHIKPSTDRTMRFAHLLQEAEKDDYLKKSSLIKLQNQIVDERFGDKDYRSTQNYVGQSGPHERVHFVSPTPEDLNDLMDGLFQCHNWMGAGLVPAVIHAAIVAYGFVFLHPFEDGNGRIHRFLIHNILSRSGFTPPGIMFPISVTMLKRINQYNASLEAFSAPLMTLVDYSLDEQGCMTVRNDTADLYRYIDFTPQAEALFSFIQETIEVELVAELRFLDSYDRAKRAIVEVVDLPDRLINLFIKFCTQNNGRLSLGKREEYFHELREDEITSMENAVREAYAKKD